MPNDLSIGVDIVSISRFSNASEKNHRFLSKFLTQSEIDYCLSKESPQQHIAARFAGKEAIRKALYRLSLRDVAFTDIEIANDEFGVPSANVKLEAMLNISVEISLSHSEDHAIAFAVAMRGDDR